MMDQYLGHQCGPYCEHPQPYDAIPADLGPWITTVSGKRFFYEHPEDFAFDPEDIAYALSNICRFAGHTRAFYSVAQHCVLVSEIVPPSLALQGLLHDAAEAYTGDVVGPLKSLLPDFKFEIEVPTEEALFGQLGVPFEMNPMVKVADLMALATEIRDLMPAPTLMWSQGLPPPIMRRIVAWSPRHARERWLAKWATLQPRTSSA
jgi:hypothetical protein